MTDSDQDNRQRLSPAHRRLLEAKLASANRSPGAAQRIPTAIDSQRFPATSPQVRFWFLNRLRPDNPAYNMHTALDLHGPLDRVALENALQFVVSDNAVLRGRFAWEDGKLWQTVADAADVSVQFHARNTYSEPDSFFMRLARKPFDLARGPLIRADVVELQRDHHVLLIVMHHIICDEPSVEIILRQLAAEYAGAGAGDDINPESVRFADYALWQQGRQKSILREQLPYWLEHLRDLEERSAVPVHQARKTGTEPRGRILRKRVARRLSTLARELAASEKTTLFPLMSATWLALLYRYTGQKDLAVGTPASLRTLPEIQGTVGMFLNTLVLRTQLDPLASFREFLRQTRAESLDAFSNPEVPLETIVEQLQPARAGDENPFFDTMIVQETEPAPMTTFGTLAAEARAIDAEVCKLDLTLFFRETPNGLLLSVEYDSTLYTQRQVEMLLEHYAALLETFCRNPDQAIADAQFLGTDELDWLRRSSAGPWQEVGNTQLVAEQVDRNLAALDEKPAIVDDMGTVSYHELNRLVDGTTDRIRAQLDSPRCVVVLLDRNRSAIAAMLAAWRAGACYVPVDPTYPAARVAATLAALDDSELHNYVIVSSTRHRHLLPPGTPQVLVDAPARVTPGSNKSPPIARPDDTAYVIFTSGSSGQPKGVRISHDNLRVSNAAREQVYGSAPDRFLLLSPLAFDSSVVGLYWTLSAGGTLVMATAEQAQDSRLLVTLIRQQRISHTLLLPALYRLVLRSAATGDLASLRTVIVAGESCPSSLPRLHEDLLPGVELYNEYGPTEATVWATVQAVTGRDESVPIGVSIPAIRSFVLDEHMQQLPPGVAGELCLCGPSLSPGYLDERQTEGAFRNLPLHGQSQRLYRTGDKVRFDLHGRLLFLGRIDSQVKVRGHRVELEELNELIRSIDGVSDAATVFDDRRHLLHSYVASDNAAVSEADVLSVLHELLPVYMLPQSVTVVARLARLPNGKIDTSSLVATTPVAQSTEPDSDDFRRLKSLWCSALKIRDCSPEDSFFDLGGHSLLAVQLLLDVEEHFGARVSLSAMYASPTLAELHTRLAAEMTRDDDEILYAAKPEGRERPLFIAQAPLEHLVARIHPELPLLGLYHGINPPPGPEVTVEDMATRYLAALRRRQPVGPYRLAGFSFGSMLALEITQQLVANGETVEKLILLDPPPPVPEGDFRFRTNRVLARIRSAGSGPAQAAFALSEARRIGRRVAHALKHRFSRGLSQAAGRVPARAALLQAGIEWSRSAGQSYQYRSCPVPTLLVVPQRPEVSVSQQAARWDSILTGDLQVLAIVGPPHHLNLLDPPWVAEVATEINRQFALSCDPEAGAA